MFAELKRRQETHDELEALRPRCPDWLVEFLLDDPRGSRALTLRQPHEALVHFGVKGLENRPTNYNPQIIEERWIAFHAGAGIDKCGTLPLAIQATVLKNGLSPAPASMIRMIVQMKDIQPMGPATTAEFGDYATGPYCIRIGRIMCLRKPVPNVMGDLGFWRLSVDTRLAIGNSIIQHGHIELERSAIGIE
jgi:hypothetical protein